MHCLSIPQKRIRVPPQTERKHIIIDNDSPEAIAELAEHLKKALN